MNFKVTARTILQLGAELISSDAIAFYELIKNAFDALSPKVEVRVGIRIDQDVVQNFLEELNEKSFSKEEIQDLIMLAKGAVDPDAPLADDILTELDAVTTQEELIKALRYSNFIMFKDSGEGMSLKDLDRVYLTIGTRNRYEQRQVATNTSRPVLGEKGLGRLSVMRLGEILYVETTKENESHYNVLPIDWTMFSHDSNALLESINIEPGRGKLKPNKSVHGTTIWIYDLKSKWTKHALDVVAKNELNKFVDPFQTANLDFINLWFNKQFVPLPTIEKDLIDNAQAILTAEFKAGPNRRPIISGLMDYKLHNRQKTFTMDGTHLCNVTESQISVLQSLGPFKLELYWYNRQRISLKYGVTDYERIKELQEKWSGGIMVYRDGFRVNPYGGPNDDWLNVDQKAFRVSGYKLNRKQIIGRLSISSKNNPKLIDQTNREGLRDAPEKSALVAILQHVLWDELKIFLDQIEKEEKGKEAVLSLTEIEKRVTSGEKKALQALDFLVETVPNLGKQEASLNVIRKVIKYTKEYVLTAKASSDSLKHRLDTTIHLAGLGLMVDIIGHELTRVTQGAGKTVGKLTTANNPKKSAELLNTLRYQLKTIETRLKVLDPLGPSGRQRKEDTDIAKLVQDTLEYHRSQFERHHIKLNFEADLSAKGWIKNVVPGMIIQIVENLVSNSVYWLNKEVLFNKLTNPTISITVRQSDNVILFTDNGPGITSERAEDIFEPFYSTKPPGDGKGLGLYISREIAEYNGASLYLQQSNEKVWRTFVLDLSKK